MRFKRTAVYAKYPTTTKYAMSAEYYVYGTRVCRLLTCELRFSPRLCFASRRCGKSNLEKVVFFLALPRLLWKELDIFRTSSSSSHDFDTATRHSRCDRISYARNVIPAFARDASVGHSASPFTVGWIFLAYPPRRSLTFSYTVVLKRDFSSNFFTQ